MAVELNIDGLVGPTHHYGGLSDGNRASIQHEREVSHPKQATLQGLKKMKRIMDAGVAQGFLPPHPRPHLPTLREAGYRGTPGEILSESFKEKPELLSSACSASSMWAANAATVSPSADTGDDRLHITPANLRSQRHRRIEPPTTTRLLEAYFDSDDSVTVHEPLESNERYNDEGAANHMRMAPSHGEPGLEIFVYGRDASDPEPTEAYPARQTREAAEMIMDNHELDPDRTLFLRQNPEAIDAGVFHNDVAAVSNEHVLFYHERAYENHRRLENFLDAHKQGSWRTIRVSEEDIPLETAVETYLFNGQLVSRSDGAMTYWATRECREREPVKNYLESTLVNGDSPVDTIRYVNVRQSMKNGGGPACLRLRVVLTESQFRQFPNPVLLTPGRYRTLVEWVKDHYRDSISFEALGDGELYRESREALRDLWDRLGLDKLINFETYWEGPL
jgi:succinylarginine dihydrolase